MIKYRVIKLHGDQKSSDKMSDDKLTLDQMSYAKVSGDQMSSDKKSRHPLSILSVFFVLQFFSGKKLKPCLLYTSPSPRDA